MNAGRNFGGSGGPRYDDPGEEWGPRTLWCKRDAMAESCHEVKDSRARRQETG